MTAIGPDRAAKLTRYLKHLGVIDPLSFAHSWCRYRCADLSELTEAQGKALIRGAKDAIRAVGTPEQKARLSRLEAR